MTVEIVEQRHQVYDVLYVSLCDFMSLRVFLKLYLCMLS